MTTKYNKGLLNRYNSSYLLQLPNAYALVGSLNHPVKFNHILCSVHVARSSEGLTCNIWAKPVIYFS